MLVIALAVALPQPFAQPSYYLPPLLPKPVTFDLTNVSICSFVVRREDCNDCNDCISSSYDNDELGEEGGDFIGAIGGV